MRVTDRDACPFWFTGILREINDIKAVHSSQAASPEEQPQLQQEICIPLPVKAVEFGQVLHPVPVLPEDMIPYDTIMQLVYHEIMMNHGIKETYKQFKNLQRPCKGMSDLAKLSHPFTSMHSISFHSRLIIFGYYDMIGTLLVLFSIHASLFFLMDHGWKWWDIMADLDQRHAAQWPTGPHLLQQSRPLDHRSHGSSSRKQLNYAKLKGWKCEK